MKIIDLGLTLAELIKEKVTIGKVRSDLKDTLNIDSTYKSIYKTLRETGLAIVPRFFDDEECQELKEAIDQTFEEYKDKIWIDNEGADKRAFGISQVSSLINEKFYNNTIIENVCYSYYNCKKGDLNGYTMANIISAKKDNLGSGGGWHRDTVNQRQFKAILYLTDVNDENGPFQYIPFTHYKKNVIKGILDYNFKFNHNRFTENDIENILEKEKKEIITISGTAGTLVLVDTSGIHRGKPVLSGQRYALTNYYWKANKNSSNQKFQNLSIAR